MGLVYLSPVPWASFAQRPHWLVRWFHQRTGGRALWVDPYPTRLPRFSDLLRPKSGGCLSDRKSPEWLTVLRPRALPIEPLPASGKFNRFFWGDVRRAIQSFTDRDSFWIGIGKPSQLALYLLADTSAAGSFYDAMDDFPSFYSGLSRRAIARCEIKLAEHVGRILVSSNRLISRFASQSAKVRVALNACALESLPAVENLRPRPTSPVLGYVGTIGHWFDWDLVIKLARCNPSVTVRLIGPIYVRPSAALPPNVELHPPCAHDQAIAAMMGFSVGLIPFKINELTASVDPIKYYEYRGLGLPVISTAFGEMAGRGQEPGVFLPNETWPLGQVVAEALAHDCDPQEIESFRQGNCWEARFDACNLLG